MKQIKINKKEQKKELILSSALIEFSSKGIESSRIEDIAKRAGVGKGTLYLYFKGKEDLLNNLFQTYAKQQLLCIKQKVINEQNCKNALYIFIDEMAKAFAKEQLSKIFLLLITNAQRNPKSVYLYKENIIQIGLPLVEEILSKGVKEGIFKAHDYKMYARLLVSPAVMEILFHALFENSKELKEDKLSNALKCQLDMILEVLSLK